MNPYTVLTLTEYTNGAEPSTDRIRIRMEGTIDPSKLIAIYELLNAPKRRRRSDAGKARKEQQS